MHTFILQLVPIRHQQVTQVYSAFSAKYHRACSIAELGGSKETAYSVLRAYAVFEDGKPSGTNENVV